jgi:carbamate kinase
VVPSPRPQQILELDAIRALLDLDIVVICAGGGGIPTLITEVDGKPSLSGVEAVIDKDFATELLARQLGADLFIMATDVDGVYTGWGTPDQRHLDTITPEELGRIDFPAGSMGPKVEAAAAFVAATGKRAAIGGLANITDIVAGTAGTQVVAAETG